MSSININKLRFQIAELLDHFSDPKHFCKSFYEIMDHYSQRSLRSGDESIAKTFMPTFNCPDQVIKQIIIGIQATIKLKPDQALKIVNELWQDQHLESRELAAKILGYLPIDFADQVMDRIILWATPNLDNAAMESLFNEATQLILKEKPELLEEGVSHLLDKKDREFQIIGLQALVSLVKNRDYDRIPFLFKLIKPFILKNVDEIVQLKTLTVLSALIERSPIETAYFLKQNLAHSERDLVVRIIRRLLPKFPPDVKTSLLDAINQN